MGIFNKKKKNDPKPEVTRKKGLTAISGELPEGFDASDPAQVKRLIFDALKEAGELPEGMTLADIGDVKSISTKDGGIKGEANLTLKAELRTAADQLKKMEGHDTPPVPLPSDPAKASFITCLNRLHEHAHRMAPMVADLYNSLDCLKMSLDASQPGAKEQLRFQGFVEGVEEMVKEMCDMGSEVCEFTSKVANRGIPAPDTSSNTIN